MADNWKQKYLDKLDEIEKKQKNWSHLEEFLRQAISRLALASEGHSKLLDEKLAVLRKYIRKNESQSKLSMVLEEISAELIRLDRVNKNKPKGHALFASMLFKNLSLSTGMEKKARHLNKLIHAKNPPEKEDLASEFAAFIKQCLEISYEDGFQACKDEKPRTSFFDRLFHKDSDDTQESSKTNSDAADKTLAQEQDAGGSQPALLNRHYEVKSDNDSVLSALAEDKREAIEKSITASLHNILESFIDSLEYPDKQKEQLKKHLFSIKPTREVHVLLNELAQMIRDCQESQEKNSSAQVSVHAQAHEILIRLLESIPLDEGLQSQAETLKQRFASGVTQEQLPQALDAIAALIVRMQQETQEQSRQLEQFLLGMSGRLREVDQFLNDNLSEHKDSWEKGMALGNAVREQVAGIDKTVNNAVDLKQLGQDIRLQLDNILQHVEKHRINENNRVKRIQKQNQELKAKIAKLEAESTQLHDKMITSIEKAFTDPLTKLPNRMAYDKHLEEEYQRWKRYHENLLLMVWDIDYFKKVNDTYGHQAGDAVLVKVASLLREHMRETDFIARFGGEEFVSLLPNTSLGGGFKVAEKMREAVQQLKFEYKGQHIPLTISCGISLFAEGDLPEDVFERADKALYQAKKAGRNRCVIAQDKSS